MIADAYGFRFRLIWARGREARRTTSAIVAASAIA
jgi:hypothetical protein